MSTWNIAVILFIIAVALLILSYYKKETSTTFQEKIEDTFLDLYQENVQLKKRLDQIEEELNIQVTEDATGQILLPRITNQIIAHYTNGKTENEIAEALDLSQEEVAGTIENYIDQGTN